MLHRHHFIEETEEEKKTIKLNTNRLKNNYHPCRVTHKSNKTIQSHVLSVNDILDSSKEPKFVCGVMWRPQYSGIPATPFAATSLLLLIWMSLVAYVVAIHATYEWNVDTSFEVFIMKSPLANMRTQFISSESLFIFVFLNSAVLFYKHKYTGNNNNFFWINLNDLQAA